MKKILLAIAIVITMVIAITGCQNPLDATKEAVGAYNEELKVYNEKVLPYNNAVQGIIDQNNSLDEASNAAQEIINKGETPFEEKTFDTLKSLMESVEDTKVSIPEKLPEYEELIVDENADSKELKTIKEQAEADTAAMNETDIPETPEVPDFSDLVKQINDARVAYEDSIQSLKQITAPTDEFVMKRLKSIKTIKEIDHVTEGNDPNGKLNKQGGYIGCIYFSDKQVDRSQLYLDDGDDVITVGTEGGGAVEIFKTKEEATVRDDYLGTYDGTGFASGSHYVYGTIIIRTSDKLNGTQQQKLTQKILDVLTKVEK